MRRVDVMHVSVVCPCPDARVYQGGGNFISESDKPLPNGARGQDLKHKQKFM